MRISLLLYLNAISKRELLALLLWIESGFVLLVIYSADHLRRMWFEFIAVFDTLTSKIKRKGAR